MICPLAPAPLPARPRLAALAQILAAVDRAAAAPAAPAVAVAGEQLLAQQDRVRRLVHRLLGWQGGNDVDDLVQDVLLAAWRHRGAFRGDSSVSTWLTRIAVRRVQRHVRWRRVRDSLRALLPVSEIDAPKSVDLGDDVRAVHGAMAGLRHADREVLVLRYLEDRDVTEVAAVLGCSRAAVDQRLTRARQRLRVLLPHLEDA